MLGIGTQMTETIRSTTNRESPISRGFINNDNAHPTLPLETSHKSPSKESFMVASQQINNDQRE